MPFGGRYRIVDFVLSNLINSGIYSTYVLIQFKSQSLLQHLRDGWEVTGLLKEHFIIPVPAQMRSPGENWYRGTADAIYQNINLIEQADPHFVVIFGADHIYRMNIREMLEFHMHKRSQATIAAIPVPQGSGQPSSACIEDRRRTAPSSAFTRRTPTRPPCRAIRSASTRPWATTFSPPTCCCGSCTPTRRIRTARTISGATFCPRWWAARPCSPTISRPTAFPAIRQSQQPYWRDVGTIDAYYDASMDLRAVTPALNLYNRQWPLRTAGYSDPPAKFIFDDQGRRGQAIDSVVSGGTILSGGMVRGSVLGRHVRVHSGALVEDSVIFDNCDIGRRARVRRAILDKNVRVPEDAEIGYDLERDREKYFVTEAASW